jgi:RNA polymerase sigma-70 factor (ECF subfamily)
LTVATDEVARAPAPVASETEPDSDSGFEAVFAAHWSRVYAALFRLLGNREEAEELALDVFLQLYRRPLDAEENGPRNLAGWLYRVATHLGLNALRARKRRRRHEEEAGRLADDPPAGPDPAGELERTETQRQVRRALAAMKPRSAQFLVLRYSGLSYGELARALQVSAGSVGTLLARAEREFEKRYRATEGN